MKRRQILSAGASAIAMVAGRAAVAADPPGVTATEIKIGNTSPYSGPASTYGVLGKLESAFFGMVTFAWLAQNKGRKLAFGLALLASFLSTILVFSQMRHFSQIFWMIPIMGFGQLSVFAVFAIYLPELFPTSLRSTGTSFCYNVGRFLAATAPFTMGRITANLGGDVEAFRTAGMWVSLVLLVGIAVLPLLPETKDQPLPEE